MIVLVHGGAAVVKAKHVEIKLKGLKNAVKLGYDALVQGKSAVDSVEIAAKSMEDDPVFNAGNYFRFQFN